MNVIFGFSGNIRGVSPPDLLSVDWRPKLTRSWLRPMRIGRVSRLGPR
jgi:hypothetical protein